MPDPIAETCPYCGGVLTRGFVALSGGLWFSASEDRMRAFIDGHLTGDLSWFDENPVATRAEFHTMVGGRGFRSGKWPREGLICESCNTVVLKGNLV